uniref:Uncharacterized protein n=1 Tax=Anguilla anguilla TaxID=7936 RepID=A0A0E9V0K3_ANGAN
MSFILIFGNYSENINIRGHGGFIWLQSKLSGGFPGDISG